MCGQKAATLARLKTAGFHIPDGFVIPVGAEPDLEHLRTALNQIGAAAWAVRSSGVAEDLEGASFAGQYESVLGVKTVEEVAAAIARVRTSGKAAHVASYRGTRDDNGPGGVAVLVQRLANARVAGIAFSANPVTGDDEVVIEAVRGLGDRLASGERDADRWIDGKTVRAVADTGVLDTLTARKIADLARNVAAKRGGPQDIEWAIEGDKLVLLQARPITGLPQAPKIEIPPGRWMKDTTHWSAPMTPAGASILLPAIEAGLAEVLPEFGFPLERLALRTFGHEVYTQEIEVGGKHNPGSPPPWWAGAIAFRLVPPLRRLVQNAASARQKFESYPRAWRESRRNEWDQKIVAESKVVLTTMNDDQVLDHLRHLIDDVVVAGVLVHFKLMVPDMVAVHELAEFCEQKLGWKTAQTLELLAGLSTTVTQPANELAEIAERAGAPAVAHGLDAIRKTKAGPQLDAWLARWGLRVIDCDPGSPTIAEFPALVLGLLRQPRMSSAAQEKTRQATVARARAGLDESSRAQFDTVLRVAELVHPTREENVLYTQSLPLGLVRRVLLEIGRRLAATGQLRAAEDVVFLEVSEIRDAMKRKLAGETAAARVSRRRAERAWARAHPGPAYHGPAPVAPPSARGLPAPLQRVIKAFLWDMRHEETVAQPPEADGTLLGVGASPGRVTGRVRVIRYESELVDFQRGEILVCPSTHSSWSVVFAQAAALVTDHGGALSHPSIVAREYGIPAVVGSGCATAKLVTGQTITVDGTTGRVEPGPRGSHR